MPPSDAPRDPRPSRLRRLLHRRYLEAELDKELDFHLDQHTHDLIVRGHAPAEARRLARLALGGPEQVKEACRDARGTRWLEDLARDVAYALRSLRRRPEFALVALFSIAIGVGVTTVVFTAVKAVVLNPLPYAQPRDLVQIATDHRGAPRSNGDWVFPQDAREILRRAHSFQSAGLYSNAVFDLSAGANALPMALYGLRISAGLFPSLGVHPALGRNILPEEDRPGHARVILLSDGLWRSLFHADPAIVGATLRVNDRECLVIGVMPAGFDFPLRRAAARTPTPYVQFWAPLQDDPATPSAGALDMVARLRPGVSVAQAQSELQSISAALAREYPATNRDRTHRLALLSERTTRSAARSLWLLMGASAMFLLIGCVNVANLLLARALARQREISIRLAIGAGRGRLVRQLLTESLILSTLGGLGGLLIAALAWRVLPSLVPTAIPRLYTARVDPTVFAFALATATLTGILFGLVPALRSTRGSMAARGASNFGRRDTLRTTLVVSEIALTLTLAVIGGQFAGRFLQLLQADPGFDPDHTYAAIVLPAPERYPTPTTRAAVYRRFLNAVRALPSVRHAGIVDALPFSGENNGGWVSAHPRAPYLPANQLLAEIDVVGGEYLQAMGVRLLRGRWFQPSEMSPGSDSAIVDQDLALRLWPGGSPVGRRPCVYCTPENPANWLRIVGVVSSMRHSSLEGEVHRNVYLSAGALQRAAFLVVRTTNPRADWDHSIRAAIASVDPAQPVLLGASLRTFVSDSIADRRFILTLLGVTALLALLLSTAGVYGVAAFVTARRTQEIALRIALGATPARVRSLLLRQGGTYVAAGLAFGLLAAAALSRLLRASVPGFESANLLLIAAFAAVVPLCALLAYYLPARRARFIDPVIALRQE